MPSRPVPEGDTIYKIARYMRPRLLGHPLVHAEAGGTRLPPLAGQTVTDVTTTGKHLLVHSGTWLLRVHLGLHGTWHRYAPQEPWKKPAFQASVILATAQDIFVCFNAADVECLQAHERPRSKVGALGPDLLGAECDMGDIVQRARTTPASTPMVDVLLDQRVAAGVGNAYKCELLFLARLHPLTEQSAVTDAALLELYQQARTLLQQNLGGWLRTTTYDARHTVAPQPRLYVYRRGGEPCLHCHTPIVKDTLGHTRRVTYWCPTCQLSQSRSR